MARKNYKYKNIILNKIKSKPQSCEGCYFNGDVHKGCRAPSTLVCWDNVHIDYIFVKKANGKRRQQNKTRKNIK